MAATRKMEFFECSAVSNGLFIMSRVLIFLLNFQKDNKGIAEIFKYIATEFASRYRKRVRTLEKMARDNY